MSRHESVTQSDQQSTYKDTSHNYDDNSTTITLKAERNMLFQSSEGDLINDSICSYMSFSVCWQCNSN